MPTLNPVKEPGPAEIQITSKSSKLNDALLIIFFVNWGKLLAVSLIFSEWSSEKLS